MDTSESVMKEETYFKCNLCEFVCKEKRVFMMHKKTSHKEVNKKCEKFESGECGRSDEECWFNHSSKIKSNPNPQPEVMKDQVFQKASSDPFPPDQMSKMFWMVSNLCRKVESIEKRFEELMI